MKCSKSIWIKSTILFKKNFPKNVSDEYQFSRTWSSRRWQQQKRKWSEYFWISTWSTLRARPIRRGRPQNLNRIPPPWYSRTQKQCPCCVKTKIIIKHSIFLSFDQKGQAIRNKSEWGIRIFSPRMCNDFHDSQFIWWIHCFAIYR